MGRRGAGEGIPLWKLLGGTRREIACGVSIGIQDSHEQLLQKIETELAAGYQRIKVKVKPGWDVDVLEKIRARWPDILLSCDANSAYTLNDLEHLKTFDRFKLLMIEQPLWSDDFYFHARLQKQSRPQFVSTRPSAARVTPRLLWNLVRAASSTSRLVASAGSPKPSRCMMLPSASPFLCGAEACWSRASAALTMWPSSTLPNFKLPGDVSASKRYWKEDIIEPEVEVSTQRNDCSVRQAWPRLRLAP